MTNRNRSYPQSVTSLLNEAHYSTQNSLGSPDHVHLEGTPLVPSLNFSSAYAFNSIDKLGDYHEDKLNSVRYARDSSLIVLQLESYFERLFGSEVVLFNSGMSAIDAAFRSLVNKNSTVYTIGSYYRKTAVLLSDLSARFDIRHQHVDDVAELAANATSDHNVIVHVESPSNPFLRLTDLEAIRASFPNGTIIYDNTFQGLVNSQGQERFADIIVGSCTKYIGGHNDLLAGYATSANSDLHHRIWSIRSSYGGILDNFSAYLLFRSLRTYDIRIARNLENCLAVLDFLEQASAVESIYYPGSYSNSDQRELFKRTQLHGGSVVTFKVDESINLEEKFSQLNSTKMAPSFGSVDTLVEIPAYMSHWGKTLPELQELGLDFRTVRLSVGIEPINYILDDMRILLS